VEKKKQTQKFTWHVVEYKTCKINFYVCILQVRIAKAKNYISHMSPVKIEKNHHPRPFWCWKLQRFCTRIWNEGRHPRRCPIHFICWINFSPHHFGQKKECNHLSRQPWGSYPYKIHISWRISFKACGSRRTQWAPCMISLRWPHGVRSCRAGQYILYIGKHAKRCVFRSCHCIWK
jgi:hypothetical protein